jgi:hypothetical protein
MKRIGKREWIVIGVAAVAVAVLIVVLVAACGGSDKSSTTASPQSWANGLCTAANTYVASLRSLGTSLQGGNLTKSSLQGLVDDAKSSTQTFADSVKGLGSPPVSDSQAKGILETLQGGLEKDADAVKSATADVSSASDILGAVSAVTGALSTAGTQIKTAYNQLKQLDPKGEAQQAFANAPACAQLTGS